MKRKKPTLKKWELSVAQIVALLRERSVNLVQVSLVPTHIATAY